MILEWLTSTTGTLVTITAFLVVVSKYYKFFFGVLKAIYNEVRRGKKIEATLAKFSATLMEIKKEVKPNGGSSLNDSVRRVEFTLNTMNARECMMFRHLPYPAFECDMKGNNTRVSDKYLKVLGLIVSDDLAKVSWGQFIHIDDREAYFDAFKYASKSFSDFSYPARFVGYNGEDLGNWKVRATLLNGVIYSGRLFPIDEISKNVLKELFK